MNLMTASCGVSPGKELLHFVNNLALMVELELPVHRQRNDF